MDDALNSLTSNLSRSLIQDQVTLRIPGVAAKLGDDSPDLVPGTLTVVEKPTGVFIEWTPSEEGSPSEGWVLTDENDERSLTGSPSKPSESNLSKLRFSVDVNDLISFKNFEVKKERSGRGHIRLMAKDGTNYVPLYFPDSDTNASFIDVLQRYLTLRRSARDPNLVIVVDEKADALAQSVTMLDQNGDILTRLMSNPYATALTGFGKISSFVHDQMIPALMDSDEISAEEKIRAMRELRQSEQEANDKVRVHTHSDTEFEVVTQLELPQRTDLLRDKPLNQSTWNELKQSDGVVNSQKQHYLKMSVFRGGVCPDLRAEMWKYLLGYREFQETNEQFEKKRSELAAEYERMKAQWMSITDDQESRFFKFSKRKGLVVQYKTILEKDVARTDRTMEFLKGDDNDNLKKLHNMLMTYVMYNFDLGYVQGMSDFASPLLYVMKNEVDAFWCFVFLMKRLHENFEKDQTHIKTQMNQLRDLVMIVNPRLANYLESHQSDDMYFCFRWVIVWFKREFSFQDTCKLWEVLWTEQPCKNFHLLICVAILDSQADTIIDCKFGLTEILKHVNELSMHLNLEEVLTSAEAIFYQLSASQNQLPAHICKHLNLGEQAV